MATHACGSHRPTRNHPTTKDHTGSTDHIHSASSVFKLFIPEPVLTVLSNASTAYAFADTLHKSNTKYIYTNDDIMHFFLINIHMGHNIKPSIRDYWYGEGASKQVQRLMTYRTYVRTAKHMHAVQTNLYSPAERAAKSSTNSFWGLGEFVSLMAAIFLEHRHARRNLSMLAHRWCL